MTSDFEMMCGINSRQGQIRWCHQGAWSRSDRLYHAYSETYKEQLREPVHNIQYEGSTQRAKRLVQCTSFLSSTTNSRHRLYYFPTTPQNHKCMPSTPLSSISNGVLIHYQTWIEYFKFDFYALTRTRDRRSRTYVYQCQRPPWPGARADLRRLVYLSLECCVCKAAEDAGEWLLSG
jgi:hypothetical protein